MRPQKFVDQFTPVRRSNPFFPLSRRFRIMGSTWHRLGLNSTENKTTCFQNLKIGYIKNFISLWSGTYCWNRMLRQWETLSQSSSPLYSWSLLSPVWSTMHDTEMKGLGLVPTCFWKGMHMVTIDFDLQISAQHRGTDDIAREQVFRCISDSYNRTSAVGFLKFTMPWVVITTL